jgi:murein DD-endopeptidase MepM/ murein hydrolase activator NlpD
VADADANTGQTTPSASSNSHNIQNPALALQANSVLGVGNDNTAPLVTTDNTGTALIPTTGPMGVSDGTDISDSSADDTSVYVVRQGDTVAGIAKLFEVSVNTILSANDLNKGTKLTEGQVLLILPISGIEYTVKAKDTLQNIATHYKVDSVDIAGYNGIAIDAKLSVGDQLMIPGADELMMSDEGGGTPAPDLGKTEPRDDKYYTNNPQIPDIADYFIDPVPSGHKTQGLHGPGHRAVDIGVPVGTSILASASGIVSLAHTGWSGGYGNMVIINHPNGTKTLYAHMSKIITYTGAQVNQGDIIGLSGGMPGTPGAGHSTGPHLHFEVFNAQNPGVDWSWKPF